MFQRVTDCILTRVAQENYRMGGKLRWPALAEVVKYRGRVRKLILDLIEATPLQLPITQDSAWVSTLHRGGATARNTLKILAQAAKVQIGRATMNGYQSA